MIYLTELYYVTSYEKSDHAISLMIQSAIIGHVLHLQHLHCGSGGC